MCNKFGSLLPLKSCAYQCSFVVGDEMFSDIYKIKETEIFYEVEGKVSEMTQSSQKLLFS